MDTNKLDKGDQNWRTCHVFHNKYYLASEMTRIFVTGCLDKIIRYCLCQVFPKPEGILTKEWMTECALNSYLLKFLAHTCIFTKVLKK